MKQFFVLALLALLLAGCGGDFASPTTTTTETTVTTTTTTTAATADLSQDNNKAVCVGLLNIGSCNTTQVNAQTVNRPAGSPAQTQNNGMSGAEMVGTVVLLCVAFVFVMIFAFAAMGSRGYN